LRRVKDPGSGVSAAPRSSLICCRSGWSATTRRSDICC